MLRLDSKDMLEAITIILMDHYGQVVEVVVPVLSEALEIALHQPLVMVGQVFKF